MKASLKNIFLTSLSVLIFTSCSSLPQKEISDQEINQQAADAYREVKAKSKFSTNKKWNDLVQRVAKRIALASNENFQWEAVLIESPEVNAWCMPGGKIAVYTGIMPVLKNEAALAAVMGHEVAHATLRHGKKGYARAIQENQTSLILAGAAIVGGELLCETQRCKDLSKVGGAAAGLALSFFNRKFSRQDESEADKTGQLYMAKAGYDPNEAIHLWERMAANNGGASSASMEWMSTHPSDSRRRNDLTAWTPAAMQDYQRASERFGLGEPIN